MGLYALSMLIPSGASAQCWLHGRVDDVSLKVTNTTGSVAVFGTGLEAVATLAPDDATARLVVRAPTLVFSAGVPLRALPLTLVGTDYRSGSLYLKAGAQLRAQRVGLHTLDALANIDEHATVEVTLPCRRIALTPLPAGTGRWAPTGMHVEPRGRSVFLFSSPSPWSTSIAIRGRPHFNLVEHRDGWARILTRGPGVSIDGWVRSSWVTRVSGFLGRRARVPRIRVGVACSKRVVVAADVPVFDRPRGHVWASTRTAHEYCANLGQKGPWARLEAIPNLYAMRGSVEAWVRLETIRSVTTPTR